MNKKLTLGALCAVVAVAGTALAQVPPPSNGFNPRPFQARQGRERHPEIWRAIRALQRAKADATHAARDFGGHRAKAAALIDEAIEQLHEALQADQH